MAKRKKSKRIPALLVLAAIIAGFFALLISKTENRVSDCLKIEQNINSVLLTAGVPEKNITSWREEKKKNLVEWLKISKEIRLKKSLWPIFSAKNILGDINFGEKYILVSKDTESGLERRIEILRDENLYCLVILSDREAAKAAKLCIVIDDCGGSKKKLIRFTQLNLPLTYAILPYQKYSREIAESLSRSGFDTLLHMPMEPHKADMKALGKGALSVSMAAREIMEKTAAALSRVPGVKGVNNHMGSLFTEDSEKMKAVMSVLKKENLFFLDSATSPKSVCKKTAEAAKVKCLRNNVFLDNIDSPEEIRRRMRQAAAIAREKGSAIAIAHSTRKHTAAAIAEIARELDDVEIVPLSALMDKI